MKFSNLFGTSLLVIQVVKAIRPKFPSQNLMEIYWMFPLVRLEMLHNDVSKKDKRLLICVGRIGGMIHQYVSFQSQFFIY